MRKNTEIIEVSKYTTETRVQPKMGQQFSWLWVTETYQYNESFNKLIGMGETTKRLESSKKE